jgi:hypothetical protein
VIATVIRMFDSTTEIEIDDGITVTEIAEDGGAPNFLGGVLEAYRVQGYEAGYARASHDLVGVIALAAGDFLRDKPAMTLEARHALLAFEAFLIQRIGTSEAAPQYVEGGLGI